MPEKGMWVEESLSLGRWCPPMSQEQDLGRILGCRCLSELHHFSLQKLGEREGQELAGRHKPLCASHIPAQPRTPPATAALAPPRRSLISSYLKSRDLPGGAECAFGFSPPPFEYNPQANGYFEWEVCPGHELAQPSAISLGILHTLNAPRREVTQRTPFVRQHNLLFCSQGGRDNWSREALP